MHNPVGSMSHTPDPHDPRSWRESMITVVNGLVVIVDIDDRTMVIAAWDSKSRHVQDVVMSEVRQQERFSVRVFGVLRRSIQLGQKMNIFQQVDKNNFHQKGQRKEY